MIDLRLGDCLELMKGIPDKSIDMILCDLPYGTTACKWDVAIPFNKYVRLENNRIIYEDEYILNGLKISNKSYMYLKEEFNEIAKDGLWQYYNRIIKENGAVVLFGSEPFSSSLRMSNIKNYKYDWIWDKVKPNGHLVAKYRPMQRNENISVFAKNKINYYPIMIDRERPTKSKEYSRTEIMGGTTTDNNGKVLNKKYPQNILVYSNASQKNKLHPTQKPVALLEYLIKTYTNEGETVLDNCMGSGSTGVACIHTNRRFIGIELDENYFNIAKNRLKKEKSQRRLFEI